MSSSSATFFIKPQNAPADSESKTEQMPAYVFEKHIEATYGYLDQAAAKVQGYINALEKDLSASTYAGSINASEHYLALLERATYTIEKTFNYHESDVAIRKAFVDLTTVFSRNLASLKRIPEIESAYYPPATNKTYGMFKKKGDYYNELKPIEWPELKEALRHFELEFSKFASAFKAKKILEEGKKLFPAKEDLKPPVYSGPTDNQSTEVSKPPESSLSL